MENDANPNPALIQPMDQNVIQNIKLGYRKLLLTTILNDPLHNENLEKTQTNNQTELRRCPGQCCYSNFYLLFLEQTCFRTVARSRKHIEPECPKGLPLDSGRDSETAVEELLPRSPSYRSLQSTEYASDASIC
ncbi:hypothetical protein AVEN_54499-1 [Araneus ventricosus]|uniref:Uncharacterized protein n=1 Tax=Araneus ventricosus TaxID=182803 RepID=A0A4Y2EIV7_ARAVE|nr:hypothetical protein AVEN_54499-1 [Araneus ventricosus]